MKSLLFILKKKNLSLIWNHRVKLKTFNWLILKYLMKSYQKLFIFSNGGKESSKFKLWKNILSWQVYTKENLWSKRFRKTRQHQQTYHLLKALLSLSNINRKFKLNKMTKWQCWRIKIKLSDKRKLCMKKFCVIY